MLQRTSRRNWSLALAWMGTVSIASVIISTNLVTHALVAEPPSKPKPPFTVSRETTFFTAPLDKDGYVDYVAALNHRFGAGITPEQNAYVPLIMVLGPAPEGGAPLPESFFNVLGVTRPPREGLYFLPFYRYLVQVAKMDAQMASTLSEQLEHAIRHPWQPNQYPLLAAWLQHYESMLAQVEFGLGRPRYFRPLIPSYPLFEQLLPDLQAMRSLALAFVARAMMQTGSGLYAPAWNDLLVALRLARALQGSITTIETLAGIFLERSTHRAIAAYLAAAPLDAKTWRKYWQEFQRLPERPSLISTHERNGRVELLEFAKRVHKNALPQFIPFELPEAEPEQIEFLRNSLDWDEALRTFNQMWDEVVLASRQPHRAARLRALAELRGQCRQLGASATEFSWNQVIQRIRAGKGREATQMVVARIILGELDTLERFGNVDDSARQSERLLILAFLITLYREEQGQLPERLEQLVPKYLPQIEPDIFSDRAPIYRRTDAGFVVYSVGLNGKDEGGRDADDSPPGERYDDIVLRVLMPRLRR